MSCLIKSILRQWCLREPRSGNVSDPSFSLRLVKAILLFVASALLLHTDIPN